MRSALDLLLDMGHERGLKEGLAVLRSVLQRLVHARFGPLNEHHAEQLSVATADEQRAIGEPLATATSVHDVFA